MKKLRLKKWVKELLRLIDLFMMSSMILILLYRCTTLGGLYEFIGFSSIAILIGVIVYAIKKDNES